MSAIHEIRKIIAEHPESAHAQTLARFVQSLGGEQRFAIADLYDLDYNTFELAIDLMKEWRLHRYFTEKGLLLDAAAPSELVRH